MGVTTKTEYKANSKDGFSAGDLVDILKDKPPAAQVKAYAGWSGQIRRIEVFTDQDDVTAMLRDDPVQDVWPEVK